MISDFFYLTAVRVVFSNRYVFVEKIRLTVFMFNCIDGQAHMLQINFFHNLFTIYLLSSRRDKDDQTANLKYSAKQNSPDFVDFSDFQSSQVPTAIESLDAQQYKMLACGSDFTAAVTGEGIILFVQ